MGDMVILMTGRQIFGIVLIIFMIAFAIGGPVLATQLTKPKSAREQDRRKKRCTAKVVGYIIDMDYNVPLEFRNIHDDRISGPTVRMIARYEFFVNGIRFTGCDYIYNFPGQKTVNVLYDPSDPSNNCTPWGRKTSNGTDHIIPLFIVLGVLAVIFLFILMAIKFFASF